MTATKTATETALTRLSEDGAVIELSSSVSAQRLEEAQHAYLSGRSGLLDVSEARENHARNLSAAAAHREMVAQVEDAAAEEARKAEMSRLRRQIADSVKHRRQSTRGHATWIKAVRQLLHMAQAQWKEWHMQEQRILATERTDFDRLRDLQGIPRPVTLAERAAYDADLQAAGIVPFALERLDVRPVHTPQSLEDALSDEEKLFRALFYDLERNAHE